MSFSKLQSSKTLIFNVFNKAKQDLERKLMVHFPRRTLNENENQITNIKQSNDNPTKTFNESKNKSKPRSCLMQMKIVLLNQQTNKKHQTLNFQSITDS